MNRRKFLKGVGLASTFLSTTSSLNAFQLRSKKPHISDVLIIGSGPAGLSLADKLSSEGVLVTVLESGIYSKTSLHQSLANVSNITSTPFDLNFASQRIIGGSTLYWGGYCPRYLHSDFTSLSTYDYGADWPLSYKEMEHYYCAAEKWLGVGTTNQSHNCTNNLFSAFKYSSQLWIDNLSNNNISNSVPARTCVNKYGNYEPLLLIKNTAPQLRQRDNLQLIIDTTARRIDFDKTGRAKGVHVENINGIEEYYEAKVVVLAAGTVQNTRLLQLSDNSLFPDGAGNEGGHLGANFMEHPHVRFWIKPSTKWLKLPPSQLHLYNWYVKNKKQGLGSLMVLLNRFNERPGWYKKEPFGSLLLDVICEQEPRAKNKLSLDKFSHDIFGDPLPSLSYKLSSCDNNTIDQVPNSLNNILNLIGGEYKKETGAFGSHLMGTTRMANNEIHGVVDSNQRVFGTKNLYISGSSVFPTGGASNPTLTLTALSLRLADHLIATSKVNGFTHKTTIR